MEHGTPNDDANIAESVAASKEDIKTWDGTSCFWKICK